MDDTQRARVGAPVTSVSLGALKPAPELDDDADRRLGTRLAGGLYLALVLVSLPLLFTSDAPPANGLALIADFVVGGALLAGVVKMRGIALCRVVATVILEAMAATRTGDGEDLVGALFVLTFMLLLLVGTPRQRRRRLSVAIATILIALHILVTVAVLSDWAIVDIDGPLADVEGGVVHGVDMNYELTVPPGLQLRDHAAARVDDPGIDTWLVHVGRDLHVTTTCHDIADVVDEGAWVDDVVGRMLKAGQALHARTRPPGVGLRRLARLEAHGQVSILVDINSINDVACIVRIVAPAAYFANNRAALGAILDSFHFTSTTTGMLDLPGDMVVGRAHAYRYRAPAGFKGMPRAMWPDDSAANDDIDQWVNDPLLGTHLITRCARAPQGEVFEPTTFFTITVDSFREDGDLVGRNMNPTVANGGRGRATLTSPLFLTIVDTAVRDDLGCSTIVQVARRHGDTVPALMTSLDTFTFVEPTR